MGRPARMMLKGMQNVHAMPGKDTRRNDKDDV